MSDLKRKLRVLHIIDSLGRGGVQTFIMNNIEELSSKGVIFDFLIRSNNSVFTDLIEANTGQVFQMPPFPRKAICNYIKTANFFRKYAKEYDAIHVHANALIYIFPLKLAKKYGIKVRIIHSHNTKSNSKFGTLIHKINKRVISKYANVFCACGDEAGKWMFENKEYIVLDNGISIEKYGYDKAKRNEIRGKNNIKNCIVIGHVGSFNTQKNHDFILEVFAELKKKQPNAMLILLGTGALYEDMKMKCKKLALEDSIIFKGSVENVNEYLSAFDVMLFPSLYEGVPFSLIEAQVAGVPILMSDKISGEVKMTDLVFSYSLERTAEEWASKLIEIGALKRNRGIYNQMFRGTKYDLTVSSEKLKKLYEKCVD